MRTSSFIVGGKVGTALGENVRVGDIDGKKDGAKLIVGSSVGGCVTVGAGVAVGAAVGPGLPRGYDEGAVGTWVGTWVIVGLNVFVGEGLGICDGGRVGTIDGAPVPGMLTKNPGTKAAALSP